MFVIRYAYYFILVPVVIGFRCDRTPYGSSTLPTEADGRFKLEVTGIEDNAYIPEQLYTVQLTATDGESTFSTFMISIEGESRPDAKNPRRITTMYPGELRPQNSIVAKFSTRCPYSVEQAASSWKSSVEVYWQAPPSGNGCISLRAMVAENDEVWFEDGGPLTLKLCEDMRQPDDVAPKLNLECSICDDAKYELSFTGLWSRNTHPYLYPENDWIPKYSDLVGASHDADFIVWMPGSIATKGLQDVAEHANTSVLETEAVAPGTRTLIKGKGHGYGKMSVPTYSFFRVDKKNHLFSAVVGIFPSPDWFLGVSRFELCQEDNTWLPERELDLYPWDAGTDSGVSYESSNVETFPQDVVSRVAMSSYDKNSPFYEMDMKTMHPFGKFHIKLIRTYEKECEETTESSEEGNDPGNEEDKPKEEDGGSESSEEKEPQEPSRYQTQVDSGDDGRDPEDHDPEPEEPVTEEPEEKCDMSPWEEWSACEGECEDGKLVGYRWRERYHLVDGVAVEKYEPHHRHSRRKEVSKYCKTHYIAFEKEACEEETCAQDEDDELTAEPRVMSPISPGGTWKSKRRDLNPQNKMAALPRQNFNIY